ncbi:MAG: thermostable hemolysin [Sphingobium sp.]
MPDRVAANLISRRYATVHGAEVVPCFTEFMAQGIGLETVAVLGYRRAERDRLFLESYLDSPIEQELTQLFGRQILRRDIIEIGNLASESALAMIALWADAANDLGGQAEIAVAVLTAPLRSMFRRLGVTLHEIAPATVEKVGETARGWGNYYQLEPIVCAGFIAEGQERLARVAKRKVRAA